MDNSNVFNTCGCSFDTGDIFRQSLKDRVFLATKDEGGNVLVDGKSFHFS